jgi:uncharacterized membrane-anchored protein YjiN (DUF445 family)
MTSPISNRLPSNRLPSNGIVYHPPSPITAALDGYLSPLLDQYKSAISEKKRELIKELFTSYSYCYSNTPTSFFASLWCNHSDENLSSSCIAADCLDYVIENRDLFLNAEKSQVLYDIALLLMHSPEEQQQRAIEILERDNFSHLLSALLDTQESRFESNCENSEERVCIKFSEAMKSYVKAMIEELY